MRVECICRRCGAVTLRFRSLSDRPYCSRACAVASVRARADDRFRSFVRATPEPGCWPWLGGFFAGKEYGQFSVGARTVRAHRYAWEMVAGPVPTGFSILHTCDNPRCVRNDDAGVYEANGVLRPRRGHLWLGTHEDNMRDRDAKGRTLAGDDHPLVRHPERAARPAGEANPMARLAADDVVAIRLAYAAGERQHVLAERYGVAITTISAIVTRKNWAHIP